MKNFGRLGIVVLILLAVCYSGLWFYRANLAKDLIQSDIDTFNAGEKGQLDYADLSVTGFPLNFAIVMDKPVLTITDATKSAILSAPEFVATSSFIGDNYRITSEVITIMPGQSNTMSEEEKVVVSIDDVAIDLGFLRNGWKDILDGDINLKEPVWYEYHDGGAKVLQQKDNAELLIVKPTMLRFSREEIGAREKLDIAFDVQMRATDALKAIAAKKGKQKEFDDFSWKCSILLEQPRGSVKANDDRKVSINKCTVAVDNFSFTSNGTIESAKDDFFPFGAVDITIQQHPLLLDILIEQRIISQQQKEVIKAIIPNVATSAGTSENDAITLALKREKNAELHIGNLSLTAVLSQYQVQMASYTKDASKEDAVAENDTKEDAEKGDKQPKQQ